MILRFLFIFTFALQSFILCAQHFELESINRSKNRDKQLMGKFDSTFSFTVVDNSFYPFRKSNWKKAEFSILPILINQQYNSTHPYGWNDGPIQQIQGYQNMSRFGFNLNYGALELQLAPEHLYTVNKSFSKFFPGQSFIKAKIGFFSVGISTENQWWGPGLYSSLLMSNNAPGFMHLFIGSKKPINTPIGHIEFKIIGGKLTSDKRLAFENQHNQLANINDDWRYLNSYVISWQPKWIKGLYLGMTRSLQQYGKEVQAQSTNFVNKYLPVMGLALQKKNNFGDDTLNRDQLASIFIRWLLAKSNAEFYVEFGKNDYGVNIRDYLMAPSHSYAYTVGFRKVISKSDIQYIQAEAELTQMTQSPDGLVRGAGNWYEHGQIFQGYTHQNQILGSGAGFGANVQTITTTFVKGDFRNGFLIQRVERDPFKRLNKWIDYSVGWMPQWKYKNMLLGAKLQLIRSNNYNWEKGNQSLNLHSRLMIQYNFK